jgi:hypothetical protein
MAAIKIVSRCGWAAALALALSAGGAITCAWAGGSGLDETDNADVGTPFFGFVKDLGARGKGIADAKVTAEIKGGNASLITRADAQGHYRLAGFGKDVDPATIDIACSADGYKLERTARRKLSNDPGAPVEVDCLMVKQ